MTDDELYDRTPRILRAKGMGSVEPLTSRMTEGEIRTEIDARYSLDTIALVHLGEPKMLMIVDSDGRMREKEANAAATVLASTNPGPWRRWTVWGDAIVMLEADWKPNIEENAVPAQATPA